MLARLFSAGLPCLGAVTLLDCARPVYVPYSPVEQKSEIEPKKLYDAAEGTLLDRGYLFQKRDEQAHQLVTKPRMLTGGEGEPQFKYVWLVATAGGTLKLELKCQETHAAAKLESCGPKVPEQVMKEQRTIAEQTLSEARGE